MNETISVSRVIQETDDVPFPHFVFMNSKGFIIYYCLRSHLQPKNSVIVKNVTKTLRTVTVGTFTHKKKNVYEESNALSN